MKNRIYLQWHITGKCGNRCRHCYQSKYDGFDVNLKIAEIIMDNLLECCKFFKARPVVAITGGDPMLNKDFWDILQIVFERNKGFCTSVLGNPELLTEKIILKLVKFKLNHFQLSLDGLEETHDFIRYPGSFKRTTEAIKKLSLANIPVYIMSTVSSLNYEQMIDVMHLSYSLGAKHYMFARWIPQEGDCGISPKEYCRFVENILEIHKKYERKGYKKLHKEPLISIYRKETYSLPNNMIAGGCGMGSSTLTLLPDNTLMACRRHPASILGKWSLETDFIYHLVDNPKMEYFRQFDKINGCKDCHLLNYCRGCRAAAYVATGDHFGKDPQCHLCHK